MLRVTVLVRHVTNLTDARFCAGMGVQLMAYPLTGPHALTPDVVCELASWTSGVQRVGEIDATGRGATEINALADACELDYVLLTGPATELTLAELNRPVIREVRLKDLEELPMFGEVSYAVLTGLTDVDLDDPHLPTRLIEAPVPVLLAVPRPSRHDILGALEWLPTLKGFALNGGAEIRPGVRDFGLLGEALEALEIEE
jgi:phosphoribosylanthranilate isomerase